MKFSGITAPISALFTAVLGLPEVPQTTADPLQPREFNAATCLLESISEDAYPQLYFGLEYHITADVPADRVEEICRAFMDDLNATRHCRDQSIGSRKPICIADQDGLEIKLWTYKKCGQEWVHRAWFHATQNKYGSVQCEIIDDIWN